MKKAIPVIAAVLCLCVLCAGIGLPMRLHGAEEPETVPVPILMYHSITEKITDKWTLGPAAFEEDLRYLVDSGYTAVTIADLVAYVEDGATLPEKPVVLTFDDCYYNNLATALPLLERYDMRMVLSVIGEYSELFSTGEADRNPEYAHLTWDDLAAMAAGGRVELANHTWGLHNHNNGRNGCCPMAGEESGQYRQRLTDDVNRLQDKLQEATGAAPVCFTYPFGSKCDETLHVLRELGFAATLSCYEGLNYLSPGEPEALYDLRRYNRSPGRSAQCILESPVQTAA